MKNKILKNLKESEDSGCTLIGAIENALTSAINKADKKGGWSVKIQGKEIFCFQHPEAGNGEITFKF